MSLTRSQPETPPSPSVASRPILKAGTKYRTKTRPAAASHAASLQGLSADLFRRLHWGDGVFLREVLTDGSAVDWRRLVGHTGRVVDVLLEEELAVVEFPFAATFTRCSVPRHALGLSAAPLRHETLWRSVNYPQTLASLLDSSSTLFIYF